MARQIPVKNKTVKVRSNVNVLGLAPGQMAEVDDDARTRGLIEAGLWTLLVEKAVAAAAALAAEPVPAPTVEEIVIEESAPVGE